MVTLVLAPGAARGADGDRGWTKQYGTSADDYGYGLTSDAAGNVYLSGWTTVGAGPTNRDATIRKIDPNGNTVWSGELWNAGDSEGRSVALDRNGNAFVVGTTTDGLWTSYHGGPHDAFVARWEAGSTGAETWSMTFGSSGDDIAYDVAADAVGNVYVAGATSGSYGATNAGGYDAFLTKFNSSGAEVWRRQFGTAAEDRALGVTVAPNGNVVLAGFTAGGLASSNLGQNDFFLVAYSPDGALLWAVQRGTAGNDVAYGLTTDASGNIFVAGSTSGGYGYDPQGGDDAFVDKFDATGHSLWGGRLIGSSAGDYAWRVAVDAANFTYVTGTTFGNVAGSGSAGSADVFVAKYNGAGDRVWLQQYGGAADDQPSALAATASGYLYVAGRTTGVMPGATGLGGMDAFVTKIQTTAPPLTTPSLVAFGEAAYDWIPSVQNIKNAGFQWWDVGMPDTPSVQYYADARSAGIVTFAYVNLTKHDSGMTDGYTGICSQDPNYPTLCSVDMTDPSWRSWLVRRADFAYSRGARGIKWDDVLVAVVNPNTTASQVSAAMLSILEAIKAAHPDMKFLLNNGQDFAQWVGNDITLVADGFQIESMMYNQDLGGGYAQWANEELAKLQALHLTHGLPVIVTEFIPADQLNSASAWAWAWRIEDYGFAPYITNAVDSSHEYSFLVAGLGLYTGPFWAP